MNATLLLEGTWEEIAAMVKDMPVAQIAKAESIDIHQDVVAVEQKRYVTRDFARRALTRRAWSDNTRVMLSALSETAEGEYVLRTTLLQEMGLSPAQFNGVLGSFGRRMQRTEGYDGETYLEFNWVEHSNEWSYRLPKDLRDEVREILGI